jgi:hypothetical protein
MKTSLYLFIIIFIFSQFSFAQNYQTFNHGRIVFFEDESKTVAALRIDSLSVDTDTILFPFKMFLPIDDFCFSPNISSWVGPKIIIKQNSENLFFNNQGDTITIKTNAVMNESWTFYQSEDLVVVAEVTDWKMQDFLDVEDSVKTISFQTFDKDMNTIEHSICERQLLLSENYGLLSILNFYLFPETDYNDSYEFLPGFYLNLIGMTNPDMGFQNPTMFRVFDFQPEDELHIFEKLEENSGKAFQRRTVFQRNTILNYLERTDSNDSIVYKVERLSYYLNFQSDSTYYIHDTIISIIKPDVNFDKLPAEPDRDEDLAPIWLLKHDGFIFKSDYGDKFQFWYQSEDCWLLGYLEGRESYQYYIDGLGGKYFNNLEFDVDYFSVHSNSLVYYKKNGETWGNPLIITNVPNESITIKFSVYPNPTKNYITILSESSQPLWVEIFDLTGNLVKTEIAHTNELLNISSLSKGFYLVRTTDEKGNIFIKKLVKQ